MPVVPRRTNRKPEHRLQQQINKYFVANGRPDLVRVFFAIPNGGLRNFNVARQLKNEGVRRGAPDLCFPLDRGRCGWLELKAKSGALSDEQLGFAKNIMALGHYWDCVRSVHEAARAFAAWGALKPGAALPEAA